MLILHIVLVPLIGLPLWVLLRKKLYRDAAVFAAVSLAGYGLWFRLISHRPLIITVMVERIVNMVAGG